MSYLHRVPLFALCLSTSISGAYGLTFPAHCGPEGAVRRDVAPIALPRPAPVYVPAAYHPGGQRDRSACDRDHDGIPDAEEARIAREYLPYLSFHHAERCGRAGLVYRLHPHPDAPGLLHLVAVVILERDCGTGSHVGDSETFGMTIDPSVPPPAGILALRAVAHQRTRCQHVSQCGRCLGLSPCATAVRDGAPYPVVFYSRNKHGAYLDESACSGACFFTNWCELSAAPADLPMVNAGEPDAPLTHDLTADGFVNAAHGWTEARLMHYDPWSAAGFGGGGSLARRLTDPAFLPSSCAPGGRTAVLRTPSME